MYENLNCTRGKTNVRTIIYIIYVSPIDLSINLKKLRYTRVKNIVTIEYIVVALYMYIMYVYKCERTQCR